MATTPRRLGKVLAAAGFAADVTTVLHSENITGVGTTTYNVFTAPEKMRFRAASYLQAADTDGTKTLKLRNETKSVDLTADLDIDALGANAGAQFVPTTVNGDRYIAKGDRISMVFTETVAGTVDPGEVRVMIELELLG